MEKEMGNGQSSRETNAIKQMRSSQAMALY